MPLEAAFLLVAEGEILRSMVTVLFLSFSSFAA